MIRRRTHDPRAVLCGSGVMAVRILDADENGAHRGNVAPLDRDHGSVTEDELRPVIADPEALREPECGAKPIARLAHVVVRELGNDLGVRNGSIGNHGSPLGHA
jgi:hypothetical protein